MTEVNPLQRGKGLLYAGGRGLPVRTGQHATGAVSPKAAGPKPATPAFSGDFGKQLAQSATTALIPVFQKITEAFLYGFLAQDLLSMVLPRIFKNTYRGREEYDPSQDPDAKNLPFKEQARLWLVKNFRGLNWEQGREEVAREVTAGPGLLLVPALAFAVIRRTFGKSALELSRPSLEGLSTGFIAKVKEAEDKLDPNEALKVHEVLQKHIRSLFIDPKLDPIRDPRLKDSSLLTNTKFLEKNPEWPKAVETSEALDQFAADWAKAVEDHAGNPKARNQALQTLINGTPERKGIVDQLWEFNRAHRLDRYPAVEIPGLSALDDAARHRLGVNEEGMMSRNLHRCDQIWVELEGKPCLVNTKGLMTDLIRWSDYLDTVSDQAARTGRKLSEVGAEVMQKLVKKKFFLGALLSAASALYLIRVTKWAMSNDSYKANRRLQLNNPAEGAPGQAATATAKGFPQQAAGVAAFPGQGALQPAQAIRTAPASIFHNTVPFQLPAQAGQTFDVLPPAATDFRNLSPFQSVLQNNAVPAASRLAFQGPIQPLPVARNGGQTR